MAACPTLAMYHILLVDDNEDISRIFASIFELHSYRVSVANSALDALEIIRNNPIDALITDFRMPGMNGGELIQALRVEQPDLPAILVTGFAKEATNIDIRTPVFTKPVNASILLHRMESMLHDLETARELRRTTDC